MNYACRDCTYNGTTAGQGGECPACGSLNFARRKKTIEEAPPSKLSLQILVVVWIIFIGMIIWKLIQ